MLCVDQQLSKKAYLVEGKLSIADLFAFAYIENAFMVQLPLDSYSNIKRWFEVIQLRKSVKRSHEKLDFSLLLS